MFRKHFRIRRRLFVGLAFAALVAPTAAQAQTGLFVDGGPAPVSNVTVSSYTPSYLRYHQVGVPVASNTLTPETKRFLAMAQATRYQQQSAAISEHSAPTITPLQADGMRWTAMAKRYQELQGTAALSERSNGVKGPDPSLVPQVAESTSTSNSFDWTDAGIGASTAIAAALLLGIALLVTRRNQHSGLTSA
jgi:hypothetical protein